MTSTDEVLRFHCAGQALLGILSRPAQMRDLAVVIVVGGPQYRVGSHRQFVKLARSLAADGYPVLRFDYRGMGDSAGEARDFLDVNADISAAIDACLRAVQPGVRRVALWGLCDGASAALMHAGEQADARVHGLLLVNPWVRSAQSLSRARLKQYYISRLMEREFWLKLAKGSVGISALKGLLSHVQTAFRRPAATPAAPAAPTALASSSAKRHPSGMAFQDQMLRGWTRFGGRIALVLSGRDLTAKEFVEYTQADAGWRTALKKSRHAVHHIAAADHTCSDAASAQELCKVTRAWLDEVATAAPTAHARPEPVTP